MLWLVCMLLCRLVWVVCLTVCYVYQISHKYVERRLLVAEACGAVASYLPVCTQPSCDVCVWVCLHVCDMVACYKKWKVQWTAQTGMSQCSTSTIEDLWMYGPAHASVKRNDGADRLMAKATVSRVLHLRRPMCRGAWDKAKDITSAVAWRREV